MSSLKDKRSIITDVADPQPETAVGGASPQEESALDQAPDGAGIRIGQLVAIEDGLVPYVVFPGQPCTAAIAARSIITLGASDIGRAAVISFNRGDLRQPIIIGCLKDEGTPPVSGSPADVEVDADGRTLTVTARDQIVLRCGKASITLTRAGKVLIRGTYLVSRSSGVNCIQGGTVEIN